MNTLIFILLLVIIALGFWLYKLKREIKMLEVAKDRDSVGSESEIVKINSVRSVAKNERKEKILELLRGKAKISNNDVENLLGVSDASATNYLSELEEEGRLRQVGETGRGIYYEING